MFASLKSISLKVFACQWRVIFRVSLRTAGAEFSGEISRENLWAAEASKKLRAKWGRKNILAYRNTFNATQSWGRIEMEIFPLSMNK